MLKVRRFVRTSGGRDQGRQLHKSSHLSLASTLKGENFWEKPVPSDGARTKRAAKGEEICAGLEVGKVASDKGSRGKGCGSSEGGGWCRER